MFALKYVRHANFVARNRHILAAIPCNMPKNTKSYHALMQYSRRQMTYKLIMPMSYHILRERNTAEDLQQMVSERFQNKAV